MDKSGEIDFKTSAKRTDNGNTNVRHDSYILPSLSSLRRRVLSVTISLVCKCNVAFGRVRDGGAKLGRENFGRDRAPATRARNFTRERTRLRVFHLRGDRCPLPATAAAENRVFALKL